MISFMEILGKKLRIGEKEKFIKFYEKSTNSRKYNYEQLGMKLGIRKEHINKKIKLSKAGKGTYQISCCLFAIIMDQQERSRREGKFPWYWLN